MASVYSDDEYLPDNDFGAEAERVVPANPAARRSIERRRELAELRRHLGDDLYDEDLETLL